MGLTALRPAMEFGSPREARAFEYYRSQSAPVLGNIMDSEFWGGLVMRLSISEPIVRHAVLALSSLHEYVSTRHLDEPPRLDPSFIFHEYGQAISSLRKWEPIEGPMVPLLASLLFTCIEFLLDHEQSAQLHIIQGRNLLCDLDHAPSSSVEMIKSELVPMYTRLGLAAFLYGGRPPSVPEHLRSFSKIPAQFKDMADARSLLYQLQDEALRFSTEVKPKLYSGAVDDMAALEARQQTILSELNQWNAAFTVLISSMRPSHAGLAVQSLLMLYYHAGIIWVSTSLTPHEEAYDAHLVDFAAIISNASSILNTSHRGSNLHAFSFETELVAPVYWTVTKCRHPTLRRAALRLLLRDELRGRRENLWNAHEAIAIGMRVIEVEEHATNLRDEIMSSTPGSDSSSSTASEYRVPIYCPPSVPIESIQVDESETLPDGGKRLSDVDDALKILSKLNLNHVVTEAPFGVPESVRVKNVIIGPREGEGVWATMFTDPIAGEEWVVSKEYLKFIT